MTSPGKPELSIVIPTKDRPEILKHTVSEALNACRNHSIELIVVNDSEQELSMNPSPLVKVVRNPGSGVATGRNFGAKNAAGELLMLLDDDMTLNEAAVDKLVAFARNNPRKLLIPNWIYPDELLLRLETDPFGRFLKTINHYSLKGWNTSEDWKSDTEIFPIEGITSQCLLFRKDEFLEMGGYDESFRYAGAEDNDFHRRLKKAGFGIFIDPTILIRHNESDRLELANWLARKRRQGFTNRHAAEKGVFEPTFYSSAKSAVLKLILPLSPFISPASQLAGRLNMRKLQVKLVGALIAANMHAGYTYDYDKFLRSSGNK